jgi:hypothetical protein
MVTPPVDVDLHSQTMDDSSEDSHGGHAQHPERRNTLEEAKSTRDELEGPTMEKCMDSGSLNLILHSHEAHA